MAGVSVFGLIALPGAPLLGEAAKELHEIGSNFAMVLAILHVLAALKQSADKQVAPSLNAARISSGRCSGGGTVVLSCAVTYRSTRT